MAYITPKGLSFCRHLHIISIWTILIVTSSSVASQPLKSFFEARLLHDPSVGAPLVMECNHVTARCYDSQKCSRTSSPVSDSIWFHNGIRLSMGVHGNQLQYDVAKTTDQGNYQCASKSSGGSLSESLRVHFTEPDIDPVPTSVTVTLTGNRWQYEDGPLSIICAGAGANVKRVTWRYKGYTIPGNHPMFSVTRVEQGMLQEKTIRSILSFRAIESQMTCEDLDQFSGIFQCCVEYEVTKSAKDDEPFVMENRETNSMTEIKALYEVSNATTVMEPMMAFSPAVLYLLCPLCILNNVTHVTWSSEGKILQNSSALSYMTRNADLSQTSVYTCESSGNRLDFMVNESNVHIKAEPMVQVSLILWDRIEVAWRSSYDIPFRYVITMMYVSGSSVMYTNFFNKSMQASQVHTFLDVKDDTRFVVKTTVLDPFNKNQTLLQIQHRQDIQTTVLAQEKPYVKSIAFWENEGKLVFRKRKVELDIVKCIKINVTLTPEWSRSKREESDEEAEVTVGNDGSIQADVTSLPPPWFITVPMTSSPSGGAAPLSIKGPFQPGQGLTVDAVFYADTSSGLPHILSQMKNSSVVALIPPIVDPNSEDGKKTGFPWYALVGVIGLIVIIILIAAILLHRRKMKKRKKQSGVNLDGETFDAIDEGNMYDYLDYNELSSVAANAPNLPPRPVRQTESWPIPAVSDHTQKFNRPKSDMPRVTHQVSETEYLLPVNERSKSAGATPACSPVDGANYLLMKRSVDENDEGIEEDSLFLQPELRRPSKEERESGYLSMMSRDSMLRKNRRPQTHPGFVTRTDSTPEQFVDPRRATVMPSRHELEDMIHSEMKSELASKDEYVSNDDLSDDTILTLPNDESYASNNSKEVTQNVHPSGAEHGSVDNIKPPKPIPRFRNSLIGSARESIDRNSATTPANSDNEVVAPKIVNSETEVVAPKLVNSEKEVVAPTPVSQPPSTDKNFFKVKRKKSPSRVPESKEILSPVKLTDQLPQSEKTDANGKSVKPKAKTRNKEKKRKEQSSEPSAATKREKFSKNPSCTPVEKSIRVPNDSENSPEVHSPHSKSFPRQFSHSPSDQDQNTQASSVYMSRTETFV